MRQILALAFCCVACAQTVFAQGDARDLLRQISDAARAMNSFRVEGRKTVNVHEPGTNRTFEATFSTALKRPNYYRNEQTTASSQVTTICDGTNYWLYFGKVQTYSKKTAEGDTACAVVVLSWEHLLDGLSSATFDGRDQFPFEGRPQECDVVRAVYKIFPLAVGIPETAGGTRTLCVDRARNLILSDKAEGLHTTAITTLVNAEVNPDLPASLFAFVPPAGSKATADAKEGQAASGASAVTPLPGGVFRVGRGVSAPTIISKVEPEFSEEARRAKVDGNVLVFLIVRADGTAGDMRVVRGLGYGLDEMAMEAIAKWRFAPGKKDGMPVSVQATIEVSFRLLREPVAPQSGVFRVGASVSSPTVLYKTDPDYTESARTARISGTVLVSLVVLPDGTPSDMRIVRSLEPGLDQKALESVSKWRFKPGMKDGAPVPVQANIEVNFRLLDNPRPPQP